MIKECVRCKENIDTSEERYIIVKDNDGKKNLKTLWYHKKCWHEVMTGKAKLNNLFKRTENLFGLAEDKLGVEKKEVYSLA